MQHLNRKCQTPLFKNTDFDKWANFYRESVNISVNISNHKYLFFVVKIFSFRVTLTIMVSVISINITGVKHFIRNSITIQTFKLTQPSLAQPQLIFCSFIRRHVLLTTIPEEYATCTFKRPTAVWHRVPTYLHIVNFYQHPLSLWSLEIFAK